MRIGSSAAPENVAYTPCPWPKFDGKIIVDVRRIPAKVEERVRAEHVGARQKIEVEDTSRRPGHRRDPNARPIRRMEIDPIAWDAVNMDLAVYALGNIYAAPDVEGGAEHYFEDDKSASEFWKLLTKAQRETIGEVKGGSSIDLTGMLKGNEDLRRWKLADDPSLREFVLYMANELTEGAIQDEAGKERT